MLNHKRKPSIERPHSKEKKIPSRESIPLKENKRPSFEVLGQNANKFKNNEIESKNFENIEKEEFKTEKNLDSKLHIEIEQTKTEHIALSNIDYNKLERKKSRKEINIEKKKIFQIRKCDTETSTKILSAKFDYFDNFIATGCEDGHVRVFEREKGSIFKKNN